MTNERMIEIMELAIEMLIKEQPRLSGLCEASGRMFVREIISEDETEQFDDYVENNAPSTCSAYRWTPYESAPRIKWLKQQIEILKK